ncbi:hypothetical protein CR492_00070 [Methylocella silvestris]|uniref:Uncharacterized protein n=2 Tax=Methylocella silvestris TaxID=199596 RepID=A0A2J7TKU3_METSI|nr:hypothetical protein CR492_00070 [Methylocella silvestris]
MLAVGEFGRARAIKVCAEAKPTIDQLYAKGGNHPMRNAIALAFASAIALVSVNASAATWPTSVVGVWHGYANTSDVVFTLITQKPTGKCPIVFGALTDNTYKTTGTLTGFYCPGSGRIVLLRKDGAGHVFQSFRGNLGQSSGNMTTLLTGRFVNYGQQAAFVEWPFSVEK